MLAAIPLGAASPQAQAGVEHWRKHLDYFWTPNQEQPVGLTELYNFAVEEQPDAGNMILCNGLAFGWEF
jgi:hypothetical protein